MLGSPAIAEVVADRIEALKVPVVFDPVMIATNGAALADPATIAAFERLMALATLTTPMPELVALGGDEAMAARGWPIWPRAATRMGRWSRIGWSCPARPCACGIRRASPPAMPTAPAARYRAPSPPNWRAGPISNRPSSAPAPSCAPRCWPRRALAPGMARWATTRSVSSGQ
jgi:hypothetical protein